MNLPEINYDKLYDGAGVDFDPAKLDSYAREIRRIAYEAGRQSVLLEGAARTALLEAQSRCLDEADAASTPTLRTLARVMADAFAQEAARYKTNQVEGFDVDKIIQVVEDDGE